MPTEEGAPKAGCGGLPNVGAGRLVAAVPNPGVPKPGGVGFMRAGVGVPNPFPALPNWGMPAVPGVAGVPNDLLKGVEVAIGSFDAGVEALGVDDDASCVASLLKTRPG